MLHSCSVLICALIVFCENRPGSLAATVRGSYDCQADYCGDSASWVGGALRVNYRGGREATAYYTNESSDAIGTAIHMVRNGTIRADYYPGE